MNNKLPTNPFHSMPFLAGSECIVNYSFFFCKSVKLQKYIKPFSGLKPATAKFRKTHISPFIFPIDCIISFVHHNSLKIYFGAVENIIHRKNPHPDFFLGCMMHTPSYRFSFIQRAMIATSKQHFPPPFLKLFPGSKSDEMLTVPAIDVGHVGHGRSPPNRGPGPWA